MSDAEFLPGLSNVAGGLIRYATEDKDGQTAIATMQTDAALKSILEWNLAARLHNDGYSPSREFRRVATIPHSILEKWRAQDGIDYLHPDNKAELKKKLNDPDWAYLRTAPGRV